VTPEEALGGILAETADPQAAATPLTKALLSPPPEARRVLAAAGIEVRLVEAVTAGLDLDPGRAGLLVAGALCWARGRRAMPLSPNWEPVATVPSPIHPPGKLRRETAETLVSLVARARHRVRVAAPFADASGMELLAVPLATATARSVQVEVYLPASSGADTYPDVGESLRRTVALEGRPDVLRIVRPDPAGPWPHLKVVTVDGKEAYVGSANLTAAGLAANLEIGAPVTGPNVAVIDALLDLVAETKRSSERGGLEAI
jgi:phosphatidylserine/phosphatidylglycerophosphate/cardiolipin synthase-like enzyme